MFLYYPISYSFSSSLPLNISALLVSQISLKIFSHYWNVPLTRTALLEREDDLVETLNRLQIENSYTSHNRNANSKLLHQNTHTYT
jgi:hypothetical protein